MSQWHAIVVEGGARELRGFVAAFLADRGLPADAVVLGGDVGLEEESLIERALVRGGHHALLVPDELASPLADALTRGGAAPQLRIVDRHPIAGASFAFAAEVFARDVSASIRAALNPLPPGVHFEQHSEQEEAHSEYKGVELYAPVHDYVYRVRGKLVGPLDGILAVRGRLAAIEAVTLEPLHLQ